MDVDESGQQRVARKLQMLRVGRRGDRRTRPNANDTVTIDQDGAIQPRLVSQAIDAHVRRKCAASPQPRARGSRASRSPSPTKLIAMTVTRIIRPGKIATHGA